MPRVLEDYTVVSTSSGLRGGSQARQTRGTLKIAPPNRTETLYDVMEV